jgi:hypothetical protein
MHRERTLVHIVFKIRKSKLSMGHVGGCSDQACRLWEQGFLKLKTQFYALVFFILTTNIAKRYTLVDGRAAGRGGAGPS